MVWLVSRAGFFVWVMKLERASGSFLVSSRKASCWFSTLVMKGIYDVYGIARTLADDENTRRR